MHLSHLKLICSGSVIIYLADNVELYCIFRMQHYPTCMQSRLGLRGAVQDSVPRHVGLRGAVQDFAVVVLSVGGL